MVSGRPGKQEINRRLKKEVTERISGEILRGTIAPGERKEVASGDFLLSSGSKYCTSCRKSMVG